MCLILEGNLFRFRNDTIFGVKRISLVAFLMREFNLDEWPHINRTKDRECISKKTIVIIIIIMKALMHFLDFVTKIKLRFDMEQIGAWAEYGSPIYIKFHGNICRK